MTPVTGGSLRNILRLRSIGTKRLAWLSVSALASCSTDISALASCSAGSRRPPTAAGTCASSITIWATAGPSCAAGHTREVGTCSITLRGIESCSASSGCWTSSRPPSRTTTSALAVPSSGAPDSTTAIVRGPAALAADRTAGPPPGGGRSPAPPRQLDPVVHDQQVMVGRGHVDAACLHQLAVPRRLGRQRSGPVQDARQGARRIPRDVQHHEDRSRQVTGQAGHHGPKRLHAARGRAHDDKGLRLLAAQRLRLCARQDSNLRP